MIHRASCRLEGFFDKFVTYFVNRGASFTIVQLAYMAVVRIKSSLAVAVIQCGLFRSLRRCLQNKYGSLSTWSSANV